MPFYIPLIARFYLSITVYLVQLKKIICLFTIIIIIIIIIVIIIL